MRITKIISVLIAIMALTALAFTFVGCSEDEPAPEFMKDKTYEIKYYDENGVFIETRTFNHGDYITYPSKNNEGYLTKWTLCDPEGNEVSHDVAIDNFEAKLSYELMDALVTVYNNINNDTVFEKYYYYFETFNTADIDVNIEKPGYTFKGYSADGGKTFATEFSLDKGSIVIEAIYEAQWFTVEYIDNDTDRPIYTTQQVNYGMITLPGAPQKDGYTFDGWVIVDGYKTVNVGGKGSTYYLTDDTVFYAVYTKNTSTT